MPLVDTRLLIFLKTFEIGGIETSTIRLVNNIEGNLNLVGIWVGDGILKQTINSTSKILVFRRVKNLLGIFSYFENLFNIYRIIKKKNFNVIHYHFRVFIPYIYIIRFLIPNTRIIYTHHSVFNDRITSLLIADIFIVISESTARELRRFKKQNIILLKHGVEIKPLTIKNQPVIQTIGFIGRFSSSKGIFILLEAFKNLLKIHSNLRLILRGDGELDQQIEEFINEYHLKKNVTIESPEINNELVYKDIDLLVVPSISLEGFGLVIIEAMSLGIPVISSDLEAFTELITDGFNGFIFNRNDSTQLFSMLSGILDKPNNLTDIINNAYNFVKVNFPIENSVRDYYGILERADSSIG